MNKREDGNVGKNWIPQITLTSTFVNLSDDECEDKS